MPARAARSTLAVAASIAGLLTTRPALSAEPASAAAQALFERARELMARGRYREACPKLAESQRLDAGVGTLLNLADCYERSGQFASAWAKFGEAAGAARQSRQFEREEIARDRLAALKPRLSTLTIDPGSTGRAGLRVMFDGVALGDPLWGVAVPVDAGVHAVEASADGTVPWRTTLFVGVKPSETTVVIPRLEPARSGAERRVGAAVAVGVGVVGVGVGLYFGGRAFGERSDGDAHCAGTRCDSTAAELIASSGRDATIATVAAGIGVVGVALGTVLYLTSAPGSRSARTWPSRLAGGPAPALEVSF